MIIVHQTPDWKFLRELDKKRRNEKNWSKFRFLVAHKDFIDEWNKFILENDIIVWMAEHIAVRQECDESESYFKHGSGVLLTLIDRRNK